MTDRELMQQALVALEEGLTSKQWRELVAALRDRLAQPEQEPFAYSYLGIKANGEQHGPHLTWKPEYMDAMSASMGAVAVPLYTTPPQCKPEQEPVCAHGIGKTKCSFCHQPQPEQEPVAHTLNCVCGAVWDVSPDGVEEMVHAPNPPQRKPLTDEEIEDIWADCPADWDDKINVLTLARAIEAKLKEKNT